MKILVAEDDRKLNDGIVLALKSPELSFAQCSSCRECMDALERENPDLLLLDVNFPDGSGLDVLRRIREQKLPVKVILLTANNMEFDIVSGLELGADDYITKPFSLMVLRARVRVQLRGSQEEKEAQGETEGSITIDHFQFDFEHMIYRAEGKRIELSKTEQKLLKALIQNRGITLTRQRLMDMLWDGESEFVDEHALTVTVKRLRDKLQTERCKKQYIKTVYGIGYQWEL